MVIDGYSSIMLRLLYVERAEDTITVQMGSLKGWWIQQTVELHGRLNASISSLQAAAWAFMEHSQVWAFGWCGPGDHDKNLLQVITLEVMAVHCF